MNMNLVPGKYIVAVSGGVDSMVLLDLLATVSEYETDKYEFIIAHYDHGIRNDSAEDRKLVEKVAHEYSFIFEYEEGELGSDTNEAEARDARYDFMKRLLKEYNADAIITAHHQDDVVETLIINMLRGTGRRGVLRETNDVKRPLLDTSKDEIHEYAKKNNLEWREDSSNQDTKHLRNYVRQVLLPKMKAQDPEVVEKLLDSSSSLKNLNEEIDLSITQLMEENCELTEKQAGLSRHWLIMLPNSVGKEVVYEAIRHLDMQSGVDKNNLDQLLIFAKTAKLHKKTPINSEINMRIEPEKIIIELV